MKCRLCKSENLFEFLDLGYCPHSDQFRKTNDEPEMRYPLKLMMCECGLAQISHTVKKEVMYTEDYLYEASITATADRHWEELADDVIKTTRLTGRAIDIGGNDGTLSLKFKERGFEVLNIDPCKEVTDISQRRGVETITGFFPAECGQAEIITGTNVFAHIHNHDEFMEALLKALKFNGVFVFESPYFGEFLKGLEYDTVYHQHILYLSLTPLIPFLAKHGLEIFDVRFSELHGGAFRCYIARTGQRTVQPIVEETFYKENWTKEELLEWGNKCKTHAETLFEVIYQLHKEGKTICCVSAPAKGMTLLNYTGIGRFISHVTEKSKLKIGRYTPGTKLPILSDEFINTDYALILAWNFAKEIMANNKGYKGKWIIPLPEIKII